MENFWEVILSNGIFAVLFVWLLFFQIKDSSQREKKYIEIINKLAKSLSVVEEIEEDVAEIKSKLVVKVKKRKQNETNRTL